MATFMLKHHLSQISKKNLQDLLKSYREGLHENETHSCMIDLVDINKIVHEYSNPLSKNYKAQITGFRIYFIRGGNSKFIKKSKNGKGNLYSYNEIQDGKLQLNIVMVPVCSDEKKPTPFISKGFAKDILAVKDKCWVLIPGGENTGLCPNNCSGSI